ncbi:hypothetical protein [Streptomyces hyderabadensis]|uniref:hypothetical protein n=1 Tax=Streptomyces hyderabadensis TaxID=598549 RepID=UPI001CF083EA|nr:hypothetical protein [Streptomyces hyderabadensis]
MSVLPLDEIRTLLGEHDDPDHRERPRDFDPRAAVRRFDLLTDALRRRFGPSVQAGLYQDSSACARFSVPAGGTGPAGGLWVELSNFGGFVTAGTGAHGTAASATGPSGEFVTWLDEVCTAAGCVFVPLDVLLEPYNGPTPTLVDEDRAFAEVVAAPGHDGEDDEDGDMQAVWADRYFDYV